MPKTEYRIKGSGDARVEVFQWFDPAGPNAPGLDIVIPVWMMNALAFGRVEFNRNMQFWALDRAMRLNDGDWLVFFSDPRVGIQAYSAKGFALYIEEVPSDT